MDTDLPNAAKNPKTGSSTAYPSKTVLRSINFVQKVVDVTFEERKLNLNLKSFVIFRLHITNNKKSTPDMSIKTIAKPVHSYSENMPKL